jgi:dihydrofolate synthase/folylpolyglutamate synthase
LKRAANEGTNVTVGTREDSDYQEAIRFLFDRINFEKGMQQPYTKQYYRLNRMRRLLAELDDPHLRCPVIHIAGTKGKGSTAWLLAEMLRRSGFRTGRYTSPHLIHLEERFAVDQINPTPNEMVAMVEELRKAVDRMSHTEGESPTFFELTTALAWKFFALKKTDFAVIEVGLGGRLDSTNVCSPTLTVITSISFDHQQQLGNTLAQIASEKAGIIKSSIPVISGVVPDEPANVIAEVAKNQSAPLRLIDRDFRWRWRLPEDGSSTALFSYEADPRVFRLSHSLSSIPLKMMGKHQAHNAALACACTDWLRELGYVIPVEPVECALSSTQIPARLQIVRDRPLTVVDTAHNEASVAALIDALHQYFPKHRKTLIFSVSRDKKYEAMLDMITPFFDAIVLTEFQNNPRVVDLATLIQATNDAIARSCTERSPSIAVRSSPLEALAFAQENCATEQDLIVVAGSFFLAADLLPSFG